MTRLTFHLIQHTHWDREWYLPRAAFQARLVPAFGAVLDLLEQEPDARFVLDGQTIIAEDALDVRPEWIQRVHESVVEQRLELGPWYILADEIVPSGESLVRNLLQGTRDSEALGGRMDVLYSPDAFGHPAFLPTLATQFGIGSAVVWRGLGRPTGADRDLYRWTGADGADVLVYHLPSAGYEIGADLTRWSAIRDELVDRAVTSHIAVFVGADHHAPHADPAALRDALQGIESGNFVRLSSLGEFFAAANLEAGTAPSLVGELRWSYGHTWTLQGTHATRARMKRRHAAIERFLQRQVEPLSALAQWHRGLDQAGMLRTATRALLQCQFHDTICGCCSDLVACEQETRFTSIFATGREISRSALHAIAAHDPDLARDDPSRAVPALLLWNPLPRPRNGVVVAEVTCFRRDILVGPSSGRVPKIGPGFEPFALIASNGEEIPVQVLSVRPGMERIDAARHYPDQDEVDVVRIAFESPQLPGLGFAAMTLGASDAQPLLSGADTAGERIENKFVTVQCSAMGRIGLIDRRSGERYPDVLGFLDEGDRGDTYTPGISGAVEGFAELNTHVLASGPLVAAVERRYRLESAGRGTVAIRAIVILHADSRVVRIRLEIENATIDHRLRVRFPVGVGDAATAGAAFGYEFREPVRLAPQDFPAEQPIPTAPAHRYVAAGLGDRGLAVLCPGFFEYEWTAQHELVITLLRSVGELSRNDLPTRPGHAGWPMATPDAQEPGLHIVEMAIAPMGEGEARDVASLEQLWEDTFLPCQGTFVRDFAGDVASLQAIGAELEGSGLVFTALKSAETGQGVVLRCYNVESAPVDGAWRFASAIASAARVRADESVIETVALDGPKSVRFTAPPRGLVTILISTG